MLVFYYNLQHKNVPFYIASFMPETSIANERFPIRQPRLQPPLRAHEFISKTCKYRLPVFFLIQSENFDKLRNIINEIDNVTLVKFKSVTKSYMINQETHIIVISLTVIFANFSYLLYYYTCIRLYLLKLDY